ncbi:hypothetical protein DY000_02015801 [Brassica cretica]|uniref:Uncharacterized protein n=1 Tax=Brassica cretica TaxID=69181 RepID=A0ABQ7CPT0_BRACR|nr:hypothetical protein DY000_02015801 [Brassica cretica]
MHSRQQRGVFAARRIGSSVGASRKVCIFDRKSCSSRKRGREILFRIRVRALGSLQEVIKASAARAVSGLPCSSNLKP